MYTDLFKNSNLDFVTSRTDELLGNLRSFANVFARACEQLVIWGQTFPSGDSKGLAPSGQKQ